MDTSTSRHTAKQQNDTRLETQSTGGEQIDTDTVGQGACDWDYRDLQAIADAVRLKVDGPGVNYLNPRCYETGQLLDSPELTLPDRVGREMTHLKYVTSTAIRVIMRHLRGTRRRRLWRTICDIRADLTKVFSRWFRRVPWGVLSESVKSAYVTKVKVDGTAMFHGDV